MELRPQPGPQEAFLSSPADIAVYGGAAGGGKTWALLLEPLRHKDVKGFTSVTFRRTYPEITNPGGLWDESEKIYPYAGGRPTKGDLVWRFPKLVRFEFSHMQYDSDLTKWDGAQICNINFDQLEHFSEKQFFYMLVRNRSMCGVKPYIRATCNPDPDSWLVDFLAWWIDEDGYAIMGRAGKIRWFVRYNEIIQWADSKEELEENFPGLAPKSVTFIPATVYDNKILLATNPEYLANLQAQSVVERERFLGDAERGGNWKVKPSAGKVFNREWFQIVQGVPNGGVWGRGWDFAATLKSLKNKDPDFTSSLLIAKVNGFIYVLDMLYERYAAGDIDNLLLVTSRQDKAMATAADARYMVRWEIEPGSSSIRESSRMVRMLAGFDAQGIASTGDKVTRAKSLSAQSSAGNVRLVAGAWNKNFLTMYHGFPDLPHDDPVDAGSVIYNEMADMATEPAPKQQQNPFMRVRSI